MQTGPIRLIATDLDGTLLNSDHALTPPTEQAVREAIAQGVLFTVATGKTFRSTIRWIEQFNIQIPVICGNGTIIHAPDGAVVHEDPIPVDVAIEAIRLGRAAGMVPVVYAGTGILANGIDKNVELLMAHHEPAPEVLPDLEKALENGHKPYKLILMNEDDHAAVAAYQRELERLLAGRAHVMRSGLAAVVEVMPLGISKGTALAYILDLLSLPAEQVIAFGDNCNDLDMIRLAGIGVAMGQSPEEVRRGADVVTGTNDEDGVAEALRRYVLHNRIEETQR